MYDAIGDFFGGYLHQDWDLDYENPESAAADFATTESRERVIRVLGEIQLLIALDDEAAVTKVLDDSGNYFLPAGSSHNDWLIGLSSEMAKAVLNRD